MAYEHIRPRFINITEDKLWGVGVYLCLSVQPICVGLKAVGVCVFVCVCP